ncbi:unnamed protein product, partial [Musa acuminata subsp. burmannicoides]
VAWTVESSRRRVRRALIGAFSCHVRACVVWVWSEGARHADINARLLGQCAVRSRLTAGGVMSNPICSRRETAPHPKRKGVEQATKSAIHGGDEQIKALYSFKLRRPRWSNELIFGRRSGDIPP